VRCAVSPARLTVMSHRRHPHTGWQPPHWTHSPFTSAVQLSSLLCGTLCSEWRCAGSPEWLCWSLVYAHQTAGCMWQLLRPRRHDRPAIHVIDAAHPSAAHACSTAYISERIFSIMQVCWAGHALLTINGENWALLAAYHNWLELLSTRHLLH
jgi:hypothetical protein